MVILAMARAAAGGETWARAETLLLSGHGAAHKCDQQRETNVSSRL